MCKLTPLSFLKKHVFFIITLSILLFMHASFLMHFNYLPSEAYGGDQYFHMGRTMHLFQGGAVYESSHYVGEYEHYPWLMNVSIATIAKIFPISVLKATIFFPFLAMLLTAIITYALSNTIIKNKLLGTFFAVVATTYSFTDAHPSEFAKYTMIPVVIYFLYTQNKAHFNIKSIVISGSIIGLSALQHVITFLFACILFTLLIVTNIIRTKALREEIKRFFLTILVALPISLLYWFPLLFIYKGNTVNNWQLWSASSIYPSLKGMFTILFNTFFNFSSPFEIIISIVIILGIIHSIYKWIKEKWFKGTSHKSVLNTFEKEHFLLPILLIISFVIGYLHPFITYPLFGFSIGYYRFPIILFFTRYLFFFVSFVYILKSIKWENKMIPEKLYKGILISLLVLLLSNYGFFIKNALDHRPQIEYALQEENKLIESYFTFSELAQKDYQDIFTSSPVISLDPYQQFLLNSLTGSKVFVTTRTHANPFVDHNKRTAELAVILYGDNEEERKQLLEKNNIKYFFSEKEGLRLQGLCKKFFEQPTEDRAMICMKTTPLYEKYLKENNISFKKKSVRLSPEDDAPQMEMLIIEPTHLKLKTKTLFEIKDGGKTPYFFFAKILNES